MELLHYLPATYLRTIFKQLQMPITHILLIATPCINNMDARGHVGWQMTGTSIGHVISNRLFPEAYTNIALTAALTSLMNSNNTCSSTTPPRKIKRIKEYGI